jgi:hypothetical protein
VSKFGSDTVSFIHGRSNGQRVLHTQQNVVAMFDAYRPFWGVPYISPERTDKLWTQFNNQQKNMGGLKRRASSQHNSNRKTEPPYILYLAGITTAPLRQKLAVQWRLRNHCKESFLISMLGRESAHSDMFFMIAVRNYCDGNKKKKRNK